MSTPENGQMTAPSMCHSPSVSPEKIHSFYFGKSRIYTCLCLLLSLDCSVRKYLSPSLCDVGIEPCFSTGDHFAPHRTFGNIWRHFCCHIWGVRCCWHLVNREVRASASMLHPTMHWTASRSKELSCQAVTGAEVKKPWGGEKGGIVISKKCAAITQGEASRHHEKVGSTQNKDA